jgi:hypothetical protein
VRRLQLAEVAAQVDLAVRGQEAGAEGGLRALRVTRRPPDLGTHVGEEEQGSGRGRREARKRAERVMHGGVPTPPRGATVARAAVTPHRGLHGRVALRRASPACRARGRRTTSSCARSRGPTGAPPSAASSGACRPGAPGHDERKKERSTPVAAALLFELPGLPGHDAVHAAERLRTSLRRQPGALRSLGGVQMTSVYVQVHTGPKGRSSETSRSSLTW